MLHYISSSASQIINSQEISKYFNDLLAGLLEDFKDLIISDGLKYIVHNYHFLKIVRNVIMTCKTLLASQLG